MPTSIPMCLRQHEVVNYAIVCYAQIYFGASAMTPSNSEELPPHVKLIQMGRAFVVSRTLYAAAKLGLADHLAVEARSAAELAGPMGVHAPSLRRLMRTLASLGILTEQPEQRFALTKLGEALKADAPGAARSAVLFAAGPTSQRGW